MEFLIGYDYKKDGYTFSELRKEYIDEFGNSGEDDEEFLKEDPSRLIVMLEDKKIIGWAIWHESNTREHQPGYSRGAEDIKILEDLANGYHEIIELHELWLKKDHRGKGYGTQFFDFFEKFVLEKGFSRIISRVRSGGKTPKIGDLVNVVFFEYEGEPLFEFKLVENYS